MTKLGFLGFEFRELLLLVQILKDSSFEIPLIVMSHKRRHGIGKVLLLFTGSFW